MQPQIAQEPVYAGIVETLRAAVPGLIAVYLFGSAARGQRRQESDVDVAVLATHPLAPETRWTLQERLADQLHSDVDLVDLRAASTVMRAGAGLGQSALRGRHNRSPALRDARVVHVC